MHFSFHLPPLDVERGCDRQAPSLVQVLLQPAIDLRRARVRVSCVLLLCFIHHRCQRHGSLPRLGCGSPATRDGSCMILNSRLRSLFTRCIAAFVSSPERATTGALRAGLACGATGVADAGGGAVSEPIVGATKASEPNE